MRVSWRACAALALGLALLALCGAGASAARPEDAPPAGPGAPPAPPAPAPGPALEATGEAFGLLSRGPLYRVSLLDAIRLGVEANLRIRAGRYDPRIAREGVTVELGAFDTLLTSNLEYGHREIPSTSAFFGRPVVTEDAFHADVGASRRLRRGGAVSLLYTADRLATDSLFTTVNPSWTQGLAVEAMQPLLRGAGDVATAEIRRARNGVVEADASQHALVQDVMLEIVAAYWALGFAQEDLLSRRKSEEVAGELLRDAEIRLEARVGTPLEVADARAGLERRRGDRIEAQGRRETAADALRALVFPFTTATDFSLVIVAIDDPQVDRGLGVEVDDVERFVRLAVASRPEIKAADARIANRTLDVQVAADAVKPQLDLVGRVGPTALREGLGDTFGELWGGQAMSGGVGVRFSMFLGQRSAKANLRRAEWARRQLVLLRRDLENAIVAEVRLAARDVLTARARTAAGLEEVRASQEGLAGENALREQGKSTNFRVLQKEDDLSSARTRVARAQADLRVAEARFWRAVGMLGSMLGVDSGVCACAGADCRCAPPGR